MQQVQLKYIGALEFKYFFFLCFMATIVICTIIYLFRILKYKDT